MAFEEVSAIRCEHSCADTRGRATTRPPIFKSEQSLPARFAPSDEWQPPVSQLPAGQSVTKGMLFDFLGNLGVWAREGFPIFQLGGASGYVWGAHFDDEICLWPWVAEKDRSRNTNIFCGRQIYR